MKRIGILLVVSMFFIGTAYSETPAKMSDDPRLEKAYRSYRQGVRDEERGDEAFRVRPGKAQRMYEHAEHYYRDATFQYEQLGLEHGLDVEKEISTCDKRYRAVHVKTNKARGKAMGKYRQR